MGLTDYNDIKEDLALLLIYLSSWKENNDVLRAWKGYDFAILDSLKEKGLIDFSFTAKSLTIENEGIKKAETLLAKYERIY